MILTPPLEYTVETSISSPNTAQSSSHASNTVAARNIVWFLNSLFY